MDRDNIITISGGSTNNSVVSWDNSLFVQNVTKQKISLVKKIKLFGITVKNKFFEISTDEFFNKVKGDKLKLKIIDSILDDYLIAIDRAKMLDQTALVEKLQEQLPVIKKETEMVMEGIDEYLTKSQYEKLKKTASKHILETKLRNYTGVIPDDIVKKVVTLKEKNIFDDFIVVHYDPKKENTELTKKEKKAKEDPIIFGLINNSDKYYFIADWIDEYCNLTMNEVVKIIGEKQKNIIPKKKK